VGVRGATEEYMMEQGWYTVRCLFADAGTYEERITLWLATDFDEAIAKGEGEATEYAEDLGLDVVGLSQGVQARGRSGHRWLRGLLADA
jgi:hypothetical protein